MTALCLLAGFAAGYAATRVYRSTATKENQP